MCRVSVLIKQICAFLVLMLVLLPASADRLIDPFDTEHGLELRHSSALTGRQGTAPCRTDLPSGPLSAVDAVDLAICNNPKTHEQWAAARFQAAQLGLASSAWLPEIAARASATRLRNDLGTYTQNAAALTLSYLLYDFGARDADIESARQLLSGAVLTQDATIQRLFLSTLQAYFAAQATVAAVESNRLAEKSAQESFSAAETRYQVGVGTPADRLQAQTALSQARLNRIKAEGDSRNALGLLANQLGIDPRRQILMPVPAFATVDAEFDLEIDALMAEAASRRPDLRAAEAQLKAAEATIDSARAQGRPSLSLGAGPDWQETDGVSRHGSSLGVTVNIPIFSGFETTYRIRAAQAQRDVKSAQREQLQQQVALDVWRTYQNLKTATETVKTTADLVASASQSERVALGRYKAGVGTVLDLLAAQSALANARLQRIQASLDWNVSRASLAQAVGSIDYSLLQVQPERKP
jgi:outer membrane protein